MTTTDPNTLDPEEIRRLPVHRDLPYNGLTEAQVRAIGADPAEVEAGRLAHLEWRQEQSVTEDAALVLAAQTAVANGDMLMAEAALALRNGGHLTAEAAFVQEWNEQEQRDAADDIRFLDADEYMRETATLDAHDRAQAEQRAGQLQQEVDAKIAAQIKERLDATVPVNDPLRAGIEAAIIHQLREGDAPSDAAGQDTLIRGALQRSVVVDDATEAIRQQVDQEWRILRKTQGKSGDLVTAADIAATKETWTAARRQQLADAKMIKEDDLKAPPTADEEQARYVERYRKRNGQSTSLHEQVGGIEQRGRDAEAARRQGNTTYGSALERERYREAVRNAEANVRVGGVETQSRNPDHPDIPPTWPDQYGPGGYSS